MVYAKMGNHSKAQEDTKALVDMDPNIAKLNASLSRNPHDMAALIKRSDLYWQKGMLDRALQDLDDAVKIEPDKPRR